jgi:hypothetical protein
VVTLRLCAAWFAAVAFGAPSLCAGCFHSNMVYADECQNRCAGNHLQCNPETGYCERVPCGGECPARTRCDTHTDECVPTDW